MDTTKVPPTKNKSEKNKNRNVSKHNNSKTRKFMILSIVNKLEEVWFKVNIDMFESFPQIQSAGRIGSVRIGSVLIGSVRIAHDTANTSIKPPCNMLTSRSTFTHHTIYLHSGSTTTVTNKSVRRVISHPLLGFVSSVGQMSW